MENSETDDAVSCEVEFLGFRRMINLVAGSFSYQLMTSPDESICFIFSSRRARVSSFLASEYQTMNSFLCVKDKPLSF